MSKNSNGKTAVLFLLSAGLILAAAATYLLSFYYRQVCFQILGGFCQRMIEKNPDSRQVVLELLKTQDFHPQAKLSCQTLVIVRQIWGSGIPQPFGLLLFYFSQGAYCSFFLTVIGAESPRPVSRH